MRTVIIRAKVLPAFLSVVAIAAALAVAGCEPEDPKIRQEVAELRARAGELEREVGRLGAEVAEAKNKAAPETGFLDHAELKRRLDSQMSQLRAALARAFPDFRVDPVNAGTITTPRDEDALLYTTEVTFGLSKGGRISNYTVRIAADRGGNWLMPSPEVLGAVAGQLAASAPEPRQPQQQQTTSGRGALNTGAPRVIEWPDQPQGNAPAQPPRQSYAPSQPQSPAPPPSGQRTSTPGGNAPFPVQDSRTIQFE